MKKELHLQSLISLELKRWYLQYESQINIVQRQLTTPTQQKLFQKHMRKRCLTEVKGNDIHICVSYYSVYYQNKPLVSLFPTHLLDVLDMLYIMLHRICFDVPELTAQ